MSNSSNEGTILISGGAGFIGSHLTRQYLEDGKKVIVIDNFSTGLRKNLPTHPYLTVLERDVVKLPSNLPKCGIIFHLASPACPKIFTERPQAILDANDLGTRNLIEIALKNNAPLIFTSTSEIYGEMISENHPNGISENSKGILSLCTDRSCYATAKRVGEELIWTAKRKRGLKGMNVRFFNIYGPNMDLRPTIYGRVIPNFIRAAINNKPLLVHGDGTQVRSFCWIEDIIGALMTIPAKIETCPLVMNIGRPEPISIIELAEKIIQVTEASSEIKYVERDPDDPDWRCPDISRANKYLNWHPEITLEEGLNKLLHTEYKSAKVVQSEGGNLYA